MITLTKYKNDTGEIIGRVTVPLFAVDAQGDDEHGVIEGRFNRDEHYVGTDGKIKAKDKKAK